MLTEAPLNPLKNKEIMAQICFDRFGFEAFNIEPQAKLSLICEGLDTGIVLDSGDGVTHCIPIYSNSILHHHIRRSNIAGRHITDYLIRLLQLKYINIFNSIIEVMHLIHRLISKLLEKSKRSFHLLGNLPIFLK